MSSTAPTLGTPVVLPSTFNGSPRNMAQNYQDAMAIVRNFGFPDFFITMTANPDWPEIQHNLAWGDRDGQTLYMTAMTGIYRIRLNIPGVRP